MILLPNYKQRERIRQYFVENSIQSITLQGDNLIIEYQGSKTETKSVNNSKELQQVKSYLSKIGKNKLSLSDLKQSYNPSNSPKSNKLPLYIGLAVVGILVVGIIAYFLTRGKKERKL